MEQGVETVIETTEFHDFTIGEVISFRISTPYGMVELNNQQSTVIDITPDTVTVPIDSREYTPFVNAGQDQAQPAMIVPSASGIIPNAIPAQTSLFDAFDHIPEV